MLPTNGFAPFTAPVCNRPRLPPAFIRTIRQHGIPPGRFLLSASVATQTLWLFEKSAQQSSTARFPLYECRRRYRISTSAFGIGQTLGSNRTPLGLHRIAEKIGGGQPIGTVFRSRRPVGLTWQGEPEAEIAHRILWLDGLEPGRNRGGRVDTRRRYIYLHGLGNETRLGRPQSHGCILLAAVDLIPLYDRLPVGTLVWIAAR